MAGGLTYTDTSKLLLDEEHMIIEKAFNILDRDQSGTIEKKELEDAVMKLGFGLEDKRAVERMLQNVDTDDSGQITKDEFHRMMSRKLTKDDTDAEISQVFRRFDPESTGKITLTQLRLVSQKLGEAVPDSELKEMIDYFEDELSSGKKKGFITYNEFVKIMRSDVGDQDTRR